METARTRYIIRDHDAGKFAGRVSTMEHIAKLLNARYGAGTVELTIKEQYRNMLEQIRERFEVVEKATRAAERCGLEAKPVPIRGGTDGAALSFRGLPCPNLPTASYGHHGPYEHAVAEDMERMVDWCMAIVEEFAK